MQVVLLSDYEKTKSGKTIKAFRPKFFIQKNIVFSNTNKIANNLTRAFKRLKPFKFQLFSNYE